MRTHFPATFLLVAAALSASRVAAQTADPSTPPPAVPAAAAALPAPASPTTTASTPDRPRPVSPAIAAHLAEKMPKFTPPAPAEASPLLTDAKAAPPGADLRETDRPRNTIISLPNYVVLEEKPPAFKERNLLTPTGRLALGFKRYPGLRFGSLPFFSNDGWALAMLEEDHRLERKAEMEDLVTLVTSPTDHAKATTEIQKAFLRSEW